MNESDLELLITIRLKNEIQKQLEWINNMDYLSDSDRNTVIAKHFDLSLEAIKFLSLLLSDCKKLEENIRYTRLRNKKIVDGRQYKRELNASRLEKFIQNMWNVDPNKAKTVRIELDDFVKILFAAKTP